jgi:hypothetical protein
MLLVGLLACSAETPEDPVRPPTHFELLRGRTPETASLPSTKNEAMISICCPEGSPLERESAAACTELARMVAESETPDVFKGWRPRCRQQVPISAFRSALAKTSVRDAAVQLLGTMETSRERARLMFDALLEMDLPGTGPGNQLHQELATELASTGETELAVIAQALHANDPTKRYWATLVLELALSLGPLDLDALGYDVMRPLRHAVLATREVETNIDSAALSLLERGKTTAIKVLSRRRRFCGSFVTTAILASFSLDGDRAIAQLARQASTSRATACGPLLAKEPPRTEVEAILRIR